MTGYRFLGAVYDAPSKRAQLMFGGATGSGPHLVRGIGNIKAVEILSGGSDERDRALSIGSDDGQTLLLLDDDTQEP